MTTVMTTKRDTAHDALIEMVMGRMRDENLTIAATAKRAGLNRGELWNWTHRRRNLRSDKLVRLLMTLNVTIRA